MDAIAASELDGGGFWGGGTFDRMSGWHVGGEEEEGEEDLPYGIGVWQRGSLSMRDLGPAAEEDVGIDVGFGGDGYGYASSYGYDNHGFNTGEWGSGIVESESTGAIPPRRGEKRRSDSLLGDGFDRPQTPSASSGALGSPLQASSSKGRGAGTGTGTGTGSLFFKTKLCVKFRAGTCPYNSNCNFAHGIEELRKPPPGWEEMVAVQDGGGGGGGGGRNIKENSSGQLVLSSSDSQRFRRTRRCKKYYSEEGCPYGERCNFLHDDQAKARESNAISLGPSASSPVSGGGGGGGGSGSSGGGGNGGGGERPSNWKTRMCNKWEMTGHCPFGQKCNFAHGLAELQMYAGVPVDSDPRTTLGGGLLSDSKQTARAASKNFPDVGSPFVSTVYGTDGHNLSTTLRHRSTYSSYSKSQKQVKLLENWKGPADEISMIYGDWIEEEE